MRDLIDRQAAIEELKSYIVDPETAISENPDDVFQYNAGIRTAVGVIMELQTASTWHRVEEELPKENGAYVVWWNYKGASYWFRGIFFDGRWLFEDGTPTPDYWMPIEPPKEVQDV